MSAAEKREIAPFKSALEQAKSRFLELSSDAVWKAELLFALQMCEGNDFLLEVANQNPFSLKMAMLNVAALGISLNPAEKFAYLVPRDGRVILDISYRGLIELAVRGGAIQWAKAVLVHQKDGFEYRGPAQEPIHTANVFSKDRGPVVGGYAMAKLASGSNDVLVETMTIEEIYAIRDKSELYRRKKKGPWVYFEDEMSKKSLLKRASKTWPRTPTQFREAVRILDLENGEGLADRVDDNGGRDIDQPQLMLRDEEVNPKLVELMPDLCARAAQSGMWTAAEDYLRERTTGPELVWAQSKLREHQKQHDVRH